MKPLLLGAVLVCLCAAPARADVITFASSSGAVSGLSSFNLADSTFNDFLTDFNLTLPTGGIQDFAWPPISGWPGFGRPTPPAKVPEPGTLSLMAMGAAAAVLAKRRASQG